MSLSEKTATELENSILEIEHRIEDLEKASLKDTCDRSVEIKYLREKHERLQKKLFSKLTPYDIVKIARHPLRPLTADYVTVLIDDFVELHGDKRFGDEQRQIYVDSIEPGLRAGKMLMFAHGFNKERIACNF